MTNMNEFCLLNIIYYCYNLFTEQKDKQISGEIDINNYLSRLPFNKDHCENHSLAVYL